MSIMINVTVGVFSCTGLLFHYGLITVLPVKVFGRFQLIVWLDVHLDDIGCCYSHFYFMGLFIYGNLKFVF